jgi:hypothetical protein
MTPGPLKVINTEVSSPEQGDNVMASAMYRFHVPDMHDL